MLSLDLCSSRCFRFYGSVFYESECSGHHGGTEKGRGGRGGPAVGVFPQLELVADEVGASQISNNLLLGKIIYGKVVAKNVVQMIIRRVWFTGEVVNVEQVELNLFIFFFKKSLDCKRIWKRRPWSANGAHLLLKEWSSLATFRELDFSLSAFWVQIHGLPLYFTTKTNTERIGSIFPKVLFCEASSWKNFVEKRYMRLQVEVDLRKLIPSGFFHNLEGRKMWIQFRYERMTEICFKCGVIGHSRAACEVPEISSQS